MVNDDTINLLKECNSGVKMAVSSIDAILDKVESEKLKTALSDNKNAHSKLGNETHKLLMSYNATDKEPNPVAKAMSWLKINVKMMTNHTDQEVAKLISDGCQMGIDSLNKYLAQYDTANEESKSLAKKIIFLEEQLKTCLAKYQSQ